MHEHYIDFSRQLICARDIVQWAVVLSGRPRQVYLVFPFVCLIFCGHPIKDGLHFVFHSLNM